MVELLIDRVAPGSPVARMSPGADSLDRMAIRLSCMLSSWLQRWARCREQPLDSWRGRERRTSVL